MQVYSVGEFCQHEGAGWSLLVADNENTLTNIKKILIDHHTFERNREMLFHENEDNDSDKEMIEYRNNEYKMTIDGHNFIIDLVTNATCIDDINNIEIPPHEHDVIRINKQTIIS